MYNYTIYGKNRLKYNTGQIPYKKIVKNSYLRYSEGDPMLHISWTHPSYLRDQKDPELHQRQTYLTREFWQDFYFYAPRTSFLYILLAD